MERTIRLIDDARAAVGQRPRSRAASGPAGGVLMDDRFARRFELAATLLLAVAAVATAWAAYQSARWHGEQAAPRAPRSPRASSRRARRTSRTARGQVDVALFTQWVDAYAREETELAAFYRKRFRAGVRAGVRRLGRDAAAEEPRRPALAVRDAAVQARRRRRWPTQLEAKAAAASAQAGADIQRADNYSLAVVLFAASLFFAGVSTRLHGRTPRSIVLGLGYTMFLASVIWIATFPVSLSV